MAPSQELDSNSESFHLARSGVAASRFFAKISFARISESFSTNIYEAEL